MYADSSLYLYHLIRVSSVNHLVYLLDECFANTVVSMIKEVEEPSGSILRALFSYCSVSTHDGLMQLRSVLSRTQSTDLTKNCNEGRHS